MSVKYSVQRTVIGLTKDSTLNGKVINVDDFLEMAPDFSGLKPKVVTAKTIDFYRISRQEGNQFAELLSRFFSEPFQKDKILDGEI